MVELYNNSVTSILMYIPSVGRFLGPQLFLNVETSRDWMEFSLFLF